ncbi:probable aminotransferase tat2 [Phtheirospermum japonicum]|uniref:Probable aminotransferase tat2 n=1 Tax=Phtheirospermum japonicum TaxID=374723 RepID=A0A830BHR4_9LAMI|nr:probable aminotransferase tat2 [Phtheirospermum japonicum]
MENKLCKWGFKNQKEPNVTIREIIEVLKRNLKENEQRPTIHLSHGDPTSYSCFRTTPVAEQSLFSAIQSSLFNGYAPSAGIPTARRAVAEYLSNDLPYKLSENDIFLTAGANHAIEVLITVLARPGANILFPRPGYPVYEARAAFSGLEVRHFDLLPDKHWEVDLDSVEALADENTIAMVVINPGNPCGTVFRIEHMQKIAETAEKIGVVVIADEVYNHLAFGYAEYFPMGIFGSIAPVITLGSISKRWLVPGWRVGWIAVTDPNGVLEKSGIVECIQSYINITADPATLVQGAVPEILEKSTEEFFTKTNDTLRVTANACFSKLAEIPCLHCPCNPDGAMSTMVKINLPLLEDVEDDMDFALKLANEESVLVLPGSILGLKNWLRLTFAVELDTLLDGLERIKAFCLRHSDE